MSETTSTNTTDHDDDRDHSVPSPSDPQPDETGTDWAYLEALTDEENRANAASDPDAAGLTPEQRRRLRRVPDPRAIRQGLGLTQHEFARRFEIPVGTLRDWEQGRRFIDATARTLLRTIAIAPASVILANRSADPNPVTAAPDELAETVSLVYSVYSTSDDGERTALANEVRSRLDAVILAGNNKVESTIGPVPSPAPDANQTPETAAFSPPSMPRTPVGTARRRRARQGHTV